MIRLENTQYSNFLHQANALRHSGSMCDAFISVKNQTFPAHRLVLACASRKLAETLAHSHTNQDLSRTLEDLSPKTFEQVLDFAYTQSLEVSKDDLQQLLKASQLLEMRPLEQQCQHYLDALPHIIVATPQKHKGNSESVEKAALQQKLYEEELQGISWIKNNIKETTTEEEPRKKSKLSTLNRGCVITSSVSNFYSSPWTIPSQMWLSMGGLRHKTHNYSTLMGAHVPQLPAEYAIALAPPPILPVQGPHFQPSTHCSVVADLYPNHKQQLYTPTNRNVNTGLQVTTILTSQKTGKIGQISCSEVHKNDRLRHNPISSLSGDTCAQCQTFVTDCKSYLHEQDLRERKPHKCQHCYKRFSLKHQLNTHHRIHTGEKPFECRVCGQRSRDFSAIIKHLRTHGGASPYRCTMCLEFCSSLVAMQRHINSHPAHDFPPDWNISSTYLYTSHISQP